jgi:hypothetical protein
MKQKLLFFSLILLTGNACFLKTKITQVKRSPADFDYCLFLDSFSKNDPMFYGDHMLHLNNPNTVYIKDLYPNRGYVRIDSKDPKDMIILEQQAHIQKLRESGIRVKVVYDFTDCFYSLNYRHCDSIECFEFMKGLVAAQRYKLMLDPLDISVEASQNIANNNPELYNYIVNRLAYLDTSITNIQACNLELK